MHTAFLAPLLGGALIGLAASVFLLATGRVSGISGILAALLRPTAIDWYWRLAFILGLVGGGFALKFAWPESFQARFEIPKAQAVISGFLVGLGSVIGSGCTSGHGVCGLARLSMRSILATLTFIVMGIATVTLMRFLD